MLPKLSSNFYNPPAASPPATRAAVQARPETVPVPDQKWLKQVMEETDEFIRDSRERSARAGESELMKTLRA